PPTLVWPFGVAKSPDKGISSHSHRSGGVLEQPFDSFQMQTSNHEPPAQTSYLKNTFVTETKN
ncbi:MAG: hypothetical protein ACUVRZ_10820, partial [Desulfobacca sp.]|uniref:hypothetical protein n=1 Tax=Desulfobacca sp. TaxID=2067990 RepID=UPI00404AE4C2